MGCINLTSVNIPDSVISIGANAFMGCTRLTSVNMLGNITSIKDNTFMGCSNLTSVNIPDRVRNIGRYAFSNCTALTSITIPDNVTSIGDNAFMGCTSLTSFKWIKLETNSPLNGTWTGYQNFRLKFTNGYYEFSRIGSPPYDKGFYYIGGNTVFFIPILGDNRSREQFSINGSKLTWGTLRAVYTRQ